PPPRPRSRRARARPRPGRRDGREPSARLASPAEAPSHPPSSTEWTVDPRAPDEPIIDEGGALGEETAAAAARWPSPPAPPRPTDDYCLSLTSTPLAASVSWTPVPVPVSCITTPCWFFIVMAPAPPPRVPPAWAAT